MSGSHEDPTDELSLSLAKRLRSGDDAAGEILERLHRPALLRFARRYLRDPHDAEDAVQEVFARILASGSTPHDFRVWSYRIARNVCLNQLRARGGRPDDGPWSAACHVAADQTGALTGLVRVEDGQAIVALLDRLSEAQREVLILRYLEGLGREAIAEVLEVPVSVVRSRLFEGVSRLRQLSAD